MANLLGAVDKAGTLAANLSVLQRKDALVTHILGHASHVSVYMFNGATEQWVSGLCAVCSIPCPHDSAWRAHQPSHCGFSCAHILYTGEEGRGGVFVCGATLWFTGLSGEVSLRQQWALKT
jgi:Dcp1-like decapping family